VIYKVLVISILLSFGIVNDLDEPFIQYRKPIEIQEIPHKELPSRSKEDDWIEFTTTWYNAGVQSTGKQPGDPAYGITCSGRPVQRYVSAAVDPSIIPLGTWFEVRFGDGQIQTRRADDTGGLVKGHHVDLYTTLSDQDIIKLGRSKVLIKILDTPL